MNHLLVLAIYKLFINIYEKTLKKYRIFELSINSPKQL